MLINNIDISVFGAKVQNKAPSHKVKKKNIQWIAGKPIVMGEEEEENSILPVRILFEANTRDEVDKNISNFLSNTSDCTLIFRNLTNSYKCFYDSHDIEETGFDQYLFLNINFLYYEFSPEQEINFTGSVAVMNTGNIEAPVILELTSPSDFIDLVIEGLSLEPITINHIKANQTITINSNDGTIKQGTVNKFDDVDMWEFPKLLLGTNNIRLNRATVKAKLRYNALWS